MTAVITQRHEGEQSVYQLFEGTQAKRVEQSDPERIAYLEEKKKLANKLGLHGQIGIINTEIKKVKSPVLDVAPLTRDEIAIWKAFLPTSYSEGIYGDTSTGAYNYDAIPMPVLQKWQECKD